MEVLGFGGILFNLTRTFATHHEKSFVPVFFLGSIDYLFDNLESGKETMFWKKDWKKS